VTDLASTAVQAAGNSSVDWTAVTAAIVSGVVGLVIGLAGIIFAWRQSKMTISAEDARAKLAEKRRIYANCITALTALLNSVRPADREILLGSEQMTEFLDRFSHIKLAATNAASEVSLIAPAEVAAAAQLTLRILTDSSIASLQAKNDSRTSPAGGALTKLIVAMRLDLGEQMPSPEEMAGVAGLASRQS